ncbi:MAG: hypothetical protein MUP70_04805 [Candidatus Aminicenantes bacterium]|nr:hypothetical protein [Candidatus Aminicenantes bacterium]
MKILKIICMMGFLSLWMFCSSGSSNTDAAGEPDGKNRAVIHAKGSLYLLSYSDDGETELKKLPFYCYRGVIENNRTLYTLSAGEEESTIARYDLGSEINKTAEFSLQDRGLRCLFVKDQNLYLGSKDLWHIDFNADPPATKQYKKIPPDYAKDNPDEAYMFEDKTIDSLAVSGDTLFAADNVMEPIYLLLYNVSNPRKPVHITTKHLQDDVNEWVRGSDADDKHYLMLRSFSRMDGSGFEIDVYEAGSMQVITRRAVYMSRQEPSEKRAWNNAVLAEDRVFVAADNQGLASFEIAEKSSFEIVEGETPCRWIKKDGKFLLSLTGNSVIVYTLGDGGKLTLLSKTELPEECTEIW